MRKFKKGARLTLYHVVIPLFLGGVIYIGFRTTSLKMFSWFKELGLNHLLFEIRAFLQISKQYVPRWILYSLPNGLWVYSLTSCMYLIWCESKKAMKFFWISLGVILAIGVELGQLAGLVPGTFDMRDLLICSLLFPMSIIVLTVKQGGKNA